MRERRVEPPGAEGALIVPLPAHTALALPLPAGRLRKVVLPVGQLADEALLWHHARQRARHVAEVHVEIARCGAKAGAAHGDRDAAVNGSEDGCDGRDTRGQLERVALPARCRWAARPRRPPRRPCCPRSASRSTRRSPHSGLSPMPLLRVHDVALCAVGPGIGPRSVLMPAAVDSPRSRRGPCTATRAPPHQPLPSHLRRRAADRPTRRLTTTPPILPPPRASPNALQTDLEGRGAQARCVARPLALLGVVTDRETLAAAAEQPARLRSARARRSPRAASRSRRSRRCSRRRRRRRRERRAEARGPRPAVVAVGTRSNGIRRPARRRRTTHPDAQLAAVRAPHQGWPGTRSSPG